MLENKVILYDDSCPMCKVYTQGFVRMGILAGQHRVGLARAGAGYTDRLDLNRARHEIPLLDLQTGEVTYGMDALFTLIGHRFPIFHPLFRSARFRALVYSVYQLVSYNRRVIAGCAPPREGFNCAPDFNRAVRLRYLRLALLTWGALVVGAAGAAFGAHQYLLAGLLMAIMGAQVPAIAQTRRGRCAWDRVGGFATNNLLFGLLLAPSLLPLPPWARWADFGLAAGLTLLDRARRSGNCRHCRGCGSQRSV